MTRPWLRFLVAGLITLLAGGSSVAFAQTDLTLEDFRELLLEYSEAVTACGQLECTANSSLSQQITDLDDEGLQTLLDTIADPDCFLDATLTVIDFCTEVPECIDFDEDGYYSFESECSPFDCDDFDPNKHPGAEELCNEQDDDCDEEIDENGVCDPQSPVRRIRRFEAATSSVLIRTGYPPDYPSGPSYDAFVATLPVLGLLDDGKTNRSDSDAVGATWIALETFKVAAIIAHGVCDAAPEIATFPTNTIACPPAAVADLLVQATQIVIDQTDYQDGNIDSAEIEAAYENSTKLISNTAMIHDRLETHDASIHVRFDAVALQIMALETKVDLLSAKIDLLAGQMNLLLERQLETVRLLVTPQGQRATDVPACDGEPCDWPYQPPKGATAQETPGQRSDSLGRR